MPVATVTGAMTLALVCVGWLIYFIHHISQSISVNHIVDRIARETELVIEELMPHPRGRFPLPVRSEAPPIDDGVILNRRSGYIRYVDINHLIDSAKAYHISLYLERRVGQFVPAGVPLARVSKPERVSAGRALDLLAAFDIGPTRGCRRSEAARMKWSEYRNETVADHKGKTATFYCWTLPAARSKNKKSPARPLVAAIAALLEALPRFQDCDFVFTNDGERPLSSFTDIKKKIDSVAGVSNWRLHDLRRTSRTLMSRAGVSWDHAEMALGHSLGGIRAVYDKYDYFRELDIAYRKLAALIERIVNPRTDNVVALRD